MFLAHMLALDENALMCDLAETYHILNYKSLPPTLVATFSCGLRENSRIMMKLSDQDYTFEKMLLADISDKLNLIWWSKTEAGMNNNNKPLSLLEKMLGEEISGNDNILAFSSGNDFTERWNEITGNGGD